MTSFEDQKKQAENFPVGTEVIYEVDDIKDDTTFPYRYVNKTKKPNNFNYFSIFLFLYIG